MSARPLVQKWVHAHAMVGVKTNVITALELSRNNDVNETRMFQPLVTTTAKRFTINEVSADKAYLAQSADVSTEHRVDQRVAPMRWHGRYANIMSDPRGTREGAPRISPRIPASCRL